jgi:hypothetical protein
LRCRRASPPVSPHSTTARTWIIGGFAREQPSAWQSLLAEFGNDELAADTVLATAITGEDLEYAEPVRPRLAPVLLSHSLDRLYAAA